MMLKQHISERSATVAIARFQMNVDMAAKRSECR